MDKIYVANFIRDNVSWDQIIPLAEGWCKEHAGQCALVTVRADFDGRLYNVGSTFVRSTIRGTLRQDSRDLLESLPEAMGCEFSESVDVIIQEVAN